MTRTIDIRELPARLQEALAIAAQGGEVILTEGEAPRARIVPCESQPPRARVEGLHTGAFQESPDFDATLPDDFWAVPR